LQNLSTLLEFFRQTVIGITGQSLRIRSRKVFPQFFRAKGTIGEFSISRKGHYLFDGKEGYSAWI